MQSNIFSQLITCLIPVICVGLLFLLRGSYAESNGSSAVFAEPTIRIDPEVDAILPLLTVKPDPGKVVESVSTIHYSGGENSVRQFTLVDDGISGDLIADDGIYSVSLPCISYESPSSFTRQLDCLSNRSNFYLTNGGFSSVLADVSIRYIDGSVDSSSAVLAIVRDDIEIVNLQQLDESSFATGSFLNIIDRNGPSFNWENRRELATRFYQWYPDDFDFLVFRTDHWMPGYPSGFHSSVKIDFEGTGSGRFDSSALFGSAGRLKSNIFINHITVGPMAHEVMHQWANFSTLLDDGSGAHYYNSNVNGILGGWLDFDTAVGLGDNLYQVQVRQDCCYNVGYAPLELYMAGLLPKEEVPPVTLLSSATRVDSYNPPVGMFGYIFRSEDGILTYTIDDIIAFEGPRDPPFGEAPTDFRMGHVVATKDILNPVMATWFDLQIRYFGSDVNDTIAFAAATGFRATIDVELGPLLRDADMTPPTNSPGQGPVPIESPLSITTLSGEGTTASLSCGDEANSGLLSRTLLSILDLSCEFTVDAAHVGENGASHIVVLWEEGGGFFQRNTDGSFSEWDGNLATLASFQQTTLPEVLTVPVFEAIDLGALAVNQLDLVVFVAYSLSDFQKVVYSSEGIRVEIR